MTTNQKIKFFFERSGGKRQKFEAFRIVLDSRTAEITARTYQLKSALPEYQFDLTTLYSDGKKIKKSRSRKNRSSS